MLLLMWTFKKIKVFPDQIYLKYQPPPLSNIIPSFIFLHVTTSHILFVYLSLSTKILAPQEQGYYFAQVLSPAPKTVLGFYLLNEYILYHHISFCAHTAAAKGEKWEIF